MRVAFNLLFVISYIIIVADGEQFRCDYKHFLSADGWVKYHPIPANWHEARLRCHLEGANLASPLNEGLKAALRSSIPTDRDCGVFTGIHATFSRGDFFSVEGVPLREIPHKWATCEPNNINNDESCLLMTSQGELADVNCSDVYPYLCYKKSSSTMVLNECGTIDNEYKLNARTGSCYKFHFRPRTWSRAYMTCAAEGAHLAIINSQEEAKVLGHIFSENKSHFWANTDKGVAFVGIHDWNEHGEWLTIEGQMLEQAGYAGWKKGEPNNHTSDRNIGQYCGAIDEFGLLDDATCTGHFDYMHTFICEKHPDPLLCNNYKEESN